MPTADVHISNNADAPQTLILLREQHGRTTWLRVLLYAIWLRVLFGHIPEQWCSAAQLTHELATGRHTLLPRRAILVPRGGVAETPRFSEVHFARGIVVF